MKNNLEAELAKLARIENITSGNPQALEHFRQAYEYQRSAALNMASLEYEKAIQLEPEFAEAHYNLGVINSNQGNRGQAEKMFSDAFEIWKSYEDNKDYQDLLIKANSHDAGSEWQVLVTTYRDNRSASNLFTLNEWGVGFRFLRTNEQGVLVLGFPFRDEETKLRFDPIGRRVDVPEIVLPKHKRFKPKYMDPDREQTFVGAFKEGIKGIGWPEKQRGGRIFLPK
ncbi:MAG: tetratricopeptide repeat protein [archaeon]